MITAQLDVQRVKGHDLQTKTLTERIEYVKENVLALMDELSEVLGEVGWKSWSTSRHINRDAAFGELRDAWQFLTNLMLVVTQLAPDELAELLEDKLYEKHTVNIRRVATGYDSTSTKCPACRRALDEPGLELTRVPTSSGNTQVYCTCGELLPGDVVTALAAATPTTS